LFSLGIDFGTSNSSVALNDGRSIRLLPLDPFAADPRVMRSLLYFTRVGELYTGQRALETYSAQNTGREVRMERRIVGKISMTFGDVGTRTGMVAAEIDTNAPGRLFQSLKRFLPDTSFTSTNVFGTSYTIEELAGRLAGAILDAAGAEIGERPGAILVGRPVHFSDAPEKDEVARTRLTRAWEFAGAHVSFLEEPLAAALDFAAEAAIRPGANLLIFDFGGGTLDITITHQTKNGAEVLATGGTPLGGDRIDSRVMQSLISSSFGDDARYRRTGLPLPNHLFAHLNTWQTILELNRPDLLGLIRRARRESDRPAELQALETLVTRNYGFELFRSIEAAKIRLTSEDSAAVELRRPDIAIRRDVTRSEFEAAIGTLVHEARGCVLTTVAAAGLEPGGIDYVVTTGGSSLIPAFRRALRSILTSAVLTETDTFTSVASGLALAAGGRT
jgi:hypothetical chaperone protein